MPSSGRQQFDMVVTPMTDLETAAMHRLSFNEELAKPLTVLRNPYHLAAIKGNIALAAFLHERGVRCLLLMPPCSGDGEGATAREAHDGGVPNFADHVVLDRCFLRRLHSLSRRRCTCPKTCTTVGRGGVGSSCPGHHVCRKALRLDFDATLAHTDVVWTRAKAGPQFVTPTGTAPSLFESHLLSLRKPLR